MSDAVDARFTEEISSKMQVPERLMLHSTGNRDVPSPTHSSTSERWSPNSMMRYDYMGMHVPDRIFVGSEAPSESGTLDIQDTVDARMNTPPLSIRLDEHSFPDAAADSQDSRNSTPTFDPRPRHSPESAPVDIRAARSPKKRATKHQQQHEQHSDGQLRDSGSLALLSDNGDNLLSPGEELKLLRRQMAKLNHRLMAVELENQQKQHREMIMTIALSAYVIGKLILWVNKSL